MKGPRTLAKVPREEKEGGSWEDFLFKGIKEKKRSRKKNRELQGGAGPTKGGTEKVMEKELKEFLRECRKPNQRGLSKRRVRRRCRESMYRG